MSALGITYLIGCLFVIIQSIIIIEYYKTVKEQTDYDLSVLPFLVLFSWISVISMCISYRDIFKHYITKH